MKRLLIFLSALLALTPLFAQETNVKKLTLDDCINITLQNNPDIAASYSTQEAQKSQLKQSKSNYLPQVNGNAAYTRSNSNSSTGNMGTNNNYSAAVNATQLIYDFGQTSSNVGIQEKTYQSAVQTTNALVNNKIYALKVAYYAVLSAEESENIYRQSVEQYTEQLKRAKAFYEVGTYPKIDVTSAQVNLNDAKLNLLTAQNTLKTKKQELLNVMGITEPENSFILEMSKTLPQFDLTLEQAINEARKNRPDLLAKQLQVESARQNVTLSQTGYAPTLTANGSYGWSGNDFPLYDRWSAGASLNVPIFSGLSTYNKVEQSKQNLLTAQHNLTALEQQILLDVKTAYLDLNNAKERIPVAELTAKQAKESYDLAVGRYKVGVGNYIEVKDAETSYSKAKLSHIQAVFDYNLAVAKLKNSIGTR